MQESPKDRVSNLRAKAAEEEREMFSDQGYISLEISQRIGKPILLRNPDRAKKLMHSYYFGTRFQHDEAHLLCSVSGMFPDFVFHPENKNYVLRFEYLNRTTGTDVHSQFQNWVDEHRKEISQKAAESLNIEWTEIEQSEPL